MTWIELKDETELEIINNNSKATPGSSYIIFKHSTRCMTSRMARNMFEGEYSGNYPVYVVYVIEQRRLSDKIADIFGVKHESPQLLLIRNGKCIYHNSHSGIQARVINSIEQSEPA